jgi:hypothetical protein
VVINPEKPGKGNFIVRVRGNDEPIVEFIGLKRPFAPLRELDFEDAEEKLRKALEAMK